MSFLKIVQCQFRTKIYLGLCLILSLILTSCAGLPVENEAITSTYPPILTKESPPTPSSSTSLRRRKVIHTVAPGETFWRISKMYDVPVATILKANKLKNPERVKMGQELIIPGAAPVRPIVSLYPNHKWRYIVIHHSATEIGDSLSFHKSHLKRGWDRGVGYHFVVNNAKSSKIDGQIETTPRWLKQLDGAHTKASDMNKKAIGICLVGNFSEDRVTEHQMESLVYLVDQLRKFYKIPKKRILRHGKVKGAITECPGTNFPWSRFIRKL